MSSKEADKKQEDATQKNGEDSKAAAKPIPNSEVVEDFTHPDLAGIQTEGELKLYKDL